MFEREPLRFGNYEVLGRIGADDTCETFVAKCHGPYGFSRLVVLKRLTQARTYDQDAARALAQEAMACARLSHPSVVRLYEFALVEGHLMMVLEHVDGLPLVRLNAALRARGDALDGAPVLALGHAVFSALAAAHDAVNPDTGKPEPIVHRDVHPGNVLVPWDGHVRLTDFGLAKLIGVSVETRMGLMKGTYGYMAPEQVVGEPVSVKTDIYLGCLLLRELLTKRRAFPKLPELALLQAMADADLPPIAKVRSGIPKRLGDLLDRGLARDPARRDVTASEMADAIRKEVVVERGREALAALLVRLRPSLPRVSPSAPDGEGELPERVRNDAPEHTPTDTSGVSLWAQVENRVTVRAPAATEAMPETVVVPPLMPLLDLTALATGGALASPLSRGAPPSIAEPPSSLPEPPSSASGIRRLGATVPPPDAFDARALSESAEPASSLELPKTAPAFATAPVDELAVTRPRIATLSSPEGAEHRPLRPPPLPTRLSLPPPALPPVPSTRGHEGNVTATMRVQRVSVDETRTAVTLPPQGAHTVPQLLPDERSATPLPALPPDDEVVLFPKRRSRPVVLLSVATITAAAGLVLVAKVMGVGGGKPADLTRAAVAGPSAPPAQHGVVAPKVAAAPKVEAAPEPKAVAKAESLKVDTVAKVPVPAGKGNLDLPPAAKGHRVYVDGSLVGEGQGPFLVRCGHHQVRIGSKGKDALMDVPCD